MITGTTYPCWLRAANRTAEHAEEKQVRGVDRGAFSASSTASAVSLVKRTKGKQTYST